MILNKEKKFCFFFFWSQSLNILFAIWTVFLLLCMGYGYNHNSN